MSQDPLNRRLEWCWPGLGGTFVNVPRHLLGHSPPCLGHLHGPLGHSLRRSEACGIATGRSKAIPGACGAVASCCWTSGQMPHKVSRFSAVNLSTCTDPIALGRTNRPVDPFRPRWGGTFTNVPRDIWDIHSETSEYHLRAASSSATVHRGPLRPHGRTHR